MLSTSRTNRGPKAGRRVWISFIACLSLSTMVHAQVGTPPGVPLADGWGLPGQAVPKDGWLVPSDAPGFGLEISEDWLSPFFS